MIHIRKTHSIGYLPTLLLCHTHPTATATSPYLLLGRAPHHPCFTPELEVGLVELGGEGGGCNGVGEAAQAPAAGVEGLRMQAHAEVITTRRHPASCLVALVPGWSGVWGGGWGGPVLSRVARCCYATTTVDQAVRARLGDPGDLQAPKVMADWPALHSRHRSKRQGGYSKAASLQACKVQNILQRKNGIRGNAGSKG